MTTNTRIDWDAVLSGVDQALEYFKSQGVKPTLRTLFYNLYSKALLPNTKIAYQGLSKHLVKARKDGRYAWNFIEDKTRVTYGELGEGRFSDNVIEDFNLSLERHFKAFTPDGIINDFFNYLKPRIEVQKWADQPEVCEIWIEKEALSSTLASWLEDMAITIRVNRGYSSWTFIFNNAVALTDLLTRHEKVIIFYLGDLDPSGMDIERFLKESLEYFRLDPSRVELIRLGVTGDQVDLYSLPPRPEDAETLEKLDRDPRMAKYTENYIVELDALVAYVPEDFHNLVIDALNNHWDETIYTDLVRQSEELDEKADEVLEDMKERARKKLRELLGKED